MIQGEAVYYGSHEYIDLYDLATAQGGKYAELAQTSMFIPDDPTENIKHWSVLSWMVTNHGSISGHKIGSTWTDPLISVPLFNINGERRFCYDSNTKDSGAREDYSTFEEAGISLSQARKDKIYSIANAVELFSADNYKYMKENVDTIINPGSYYSQSDYKTYTFSEDTLRSITLDDNAVANDFKDALLQTYIYIWYNVHEYSTQPMVCSGNRYVNGQGKTGNAIPGSYYGINMNCLIELPHPDGLPEDEPPITEYKFQHELKLKKGEKWKLTDHGFTQEQAEEWYKVWQTSGKVAPTNALVSLSKENGVIYITAAKTAPTHEDWYDWETISWTKDGWVSSSSGGTYVEGTGSGDGSGQILVAPLHKEWGRVRVAVEETTGFVTIEKISDRLDVTDYSINGARFTIYNSDGTTVAKDVNGTPLSNISITNGKSTKYELEKGTYVIKETTTPDGFTKANDQTVTLNAGEDKTVSFINYLNSGKSKVKKNY